MTEIDLVGHVSGCDCIIVDDMIDTAGTLCIAANELTSLGARRVFAFATHGLFSDQAAERIEGSSLEEVVVANTIPLSPQVGNRIHTSPPPSPPPFPFTKPPSRIHTSASTPPHSHLPIHEATIRPSPQVSKDTRKVRQVSVGKLLAQVINCIHTGDSVSRLFDPSQGAALLA